MAVRWTADEVASLVEAASSHTVKELAQLFGRSESAMRQACQQFGAYPIDGRTKAAQDAGEASELQLGVLRHEPTTAAGQSWTPEEDERLKEQAPGLTIAELSTEFGRSKKAIFYRCQSLDVKPRDGRTTEKAKARMSMRRKAMLPSQPPVEVTGQTQSCLGSLHQGIKLPVESFPWNRSGLSRRNKCVECLRVGNAQRQQAFRDKWRPSDWQPSKGQVVCGPDGHRCTQCGEVKANIEYYEDSSSPCNHASKCKSCLREARQERWHQNKGEHRDKDIVRRSQWSPERRAEWLKGQWVYHIKRDFSMTPEYYDSLLKAQGDVCKACKQVETKVNHISGVLQRLAVDHDHKCCVKTPTCGKCVRGLLCARCNTLVGKFEQDLSVGANILEYLFDILG